MLFAYNESFFKCKCTDSTALSTLGTQLSAHSDRKAARQFCYLCAESSRIVSIQEIIARFRQSEQVRTLLSALQAPAPRVHAKGLIGSGDAMAAVALSEELDRPMLYVLPNHEDAVFFLSDLEGLLDRQVLFFPSSFRKPFDFTQSDSAHVLQRAETLNALAQEKAAPQMVVTYPEALAEKVINRQDLRDNTLAITESSKLDIDFINEFLQEYAFERVDFVYEPGQYAIRGGIVDIFSFSNDLPYRIEFFGKEIESIRTFDTESQLSVSKIHTVTIVPNVQAKFLTESSISLLEYIAPDSVLWVKDVQFTMDIV